MSNPFQDDDLDFLVLANHENQHSLWPARTAVPDGWSVVFGAADRGNCLAYIDDHWTDLRPASLIASGTDE